MPSVMIRVARAVAPRDETVGMVACRTACTPDGDADHELTDSVIVAIRSTPAEAFDPTGAVFIWGLLHIGVEERPNLGHDDRAFANRGSNALDRACTNVADGEDPRL